MTPLVLFSFNFLSPTVYYKSAQKTRAPTHPQCSAPAAQPEFERMTFIKLSAELSGWSMHIDLCFSVSLLCRSHPKRPSSCCQSVITAISAVNKCAEYIIHSRLSTSAPYCIVKCAVKSENVNSCIKKLFIADLTFKNDFLKLLFLT